MPPFKPTPALKRPAAASSHQPHPKHRKSGLAWDSLIFKEGCHVPRYYGSVTVYTDVKAGVWRVKPRPGCKIERKIPFKNTTSQQTEQWTLVVAHVKSLKQV